MSIFLIGAIGYAIVGTLFAVLTALILFSWRGQRIGITLIIACSLSSLWGITHALNTQSVVVSPVFLFAVELLRIGSWIVFLVHLASILNISRLLRVIALSICVLALFGGVILSSGQVWTYSVTALRQIIVPGGLAIVAIGLILIEQLYRNAKEESRRGLNPLVVGLGGLFAYDLFLYSQAMLQGTIDPTSWLARGAVNALFVPFIAIGVRRNRDWALRIFVSRQVVFYSTTLVAVGIYLVVVVLGAWFIDRIGGTWAGFVSTVFIAGSSIVLITLLFSTTLRARLKVFLNKHFFSNKYDYRQEWLRLISTLSAFENSSTREVVIKAMAQIVESPSGALWVRAEKEKRFVLAARYNRDDVLADIEPDDPLVRFIEKHAWLVDLEEYRQHPQRYGDFRAPEWIENAPNYWLFVPLLLRNDLLGIILLDRAVVVPELNYEDRDLLKTVGNHIAVHLAQEQSDSLLSEARQFETYNKLTAFLMHDLNNLIAQQSLIVTNAEKHRRNPEFVDDAIQTIASSVARMKRVMAQLKSGKADVRRAHTELRFVVSAAVDRCSGKEPVPALELNGVDALIDAPSEEFTMILAHLIQNAQDATPADGEVNVSLEQQARSVAIRIRDTGCGMTPEFVRTRLFRPFDSTKGSQGMGIGAYQAREFARRMSGDLQVESTVGQGTTMSLILPID